MPENQYLPHGTGPGATVLTPAQWAARPARTTGFQNGVADPAECNTAWRAPSVAASMLGRFIVTRGLVDALDNGVVEELQTGFEKALKGYIGSIFNEIADDPSLVHYAEAAGTANAITATPTPEITALAKGTLLELVVALPNTGGVTLNVGVGGAKSVRRHDGQPLVAGDLDAGIWLLVYDGTRWLVVGLVASEIAAIAAGTSIVHFGIDTPGANTLVSTFTPPIAALVDGDIFEIAPGATNTSSAVTLNANGKGAKAIVRSDGAPLRPDDLKVGVTRLLRWHAPTEKFRVFGDVVSQTAIEFVRISPNAVLWVRTDGDDNNDGLANTPERAFKTIGAALTAASYLFLAGTALTVRLGIAGTYPWPTGGSPFNGELVIRGNEADQDSYIISCGATSDAATISAAPNQSLQLAGLRLNNLGTFRDTLAASGNANVGLRFVTVGGVAASRARIFLNGGASCSLGDGCKINGSNSSAISVSDASLSIPSLATITVTGTPDFSNAFASVTNGGRIIAGSGAAIVGAATGSRYALSRYSIVQAGGGGEFFFPGNADGTKSDSLYFL